MAKQILGTCFYITWAADVEEVNKKIFHPNPCSIIVAPIVGADNRYFIRFKNKQALALFRLCMGRLENERVVNNFYQGEITIPGAQGDTQSFRNVLIRQGWEIKEF